MNLKNQSSGVCPGEGSWVPSSSEAGPGLCLMLDFDGSSVPKSSIKSQSLSPKLFLQFLLTLDDQSDRLHLGDI